MYYLTTVIVCVALATLKKKNKKEKGFGMFLKTQKRIK